MLQIRTTTLNRNRIMALLIVLAAGAALPGCAGTGGMTLQDWTSKPRPNYEPIEQYDIDRVGEEVDRLAERTYRVTCEYVRECDRSEAWQAYQNDIRACQQNAGSKEEASKCEESVLEGIPQSSVNALNAFKASNKARVNAQYEQLGSVVTLSARTAELSANLAELIDDDEMSLGEKLSAGFAMRGAIGQIKKQVAFLSRARAFYGEQKAIMKAFETHEGR